MMNEQPKETIITIEANVNPSTIIETILHSIVAAAIILKEINSCFKIAIEKGKKIIIDKMKRS